MVTTSSVSSSSPFGTISSPGVGSGLDINSIINGIMSVEQLPLTNLQNKDTDLHTQLSAIGKLQSAISAFQSSMQDLSSASKYLAYSATSSDTSVLSASATQSAAQGSYSVQVTRIAENHRMVAANTFADTDTTTIGTSGDTMTIGVGGNNFTVSTGGLTLGQIRDAINNATDNTGVTATIIKDNSGYHLELSANDTGSTHALSVSYSGADPFNFTTLNADRNGDGSFTSADLDAEVTLEGQFQITSSSNTISDAIQGVSLTLTAAGSTTLNITRDTSTVSDSVKAVGDAFSSLVSTIRGLENGDLKNQSNILVSIENQLRRVITTPVSISGSSFTTLSQIGLQTQKDGSLTVNQTTLDKALQTNFSGVSALLTDSTSGIAVQLQQIATNLLDTNGPIESRTDSLNRQIKSNENQQAALQSRLDTLRNTLVKQYTAMDSLVATLQNTTTYLTQQFFNTKSSTGSSG